MNMHVPQSLQTSSELLYLASVPLQIISPRVHTPLFNLYRILQLGIFRLTDDNVYLNRIQMMNILIYVKSFDGEFLSLKLKIRLKWSGRQLFSIILPKNINLEKKNKSYDNHPLNITR